MKKLTKYKVYIENWDSETGYHYLGTHEGETRQDAIDIGVEVSYKEEDDDYRKSAKTICITKYYSGYKDKTKTIRCTRCGSEFSEIEMEGAKCCPSCGTLGIPMAIENDVNIIINWHEFRLLTIWAENWARQMDDEKNEDEKLGLE